MRTVADFDGRIRRHARLRHEGSLAVLDGAEDALFEDFFLDVQRRGDQRVDVDLGIVAEHDAVLVDEIDLAVGLQATVDDTRVVVMNAIERDRRR